MQLLSALSSTASPLAMQATPLAGIAADAFAALFAGIAPEGGGDGRQAAAEPGKGLPVAGMPAVPVAGVPVVGAPTIALPTAPAAADPVVAPVLPVSASEAIAMVPGEPTPPTVRDAVPVMAAAGVVGALKLLPEEEPVAVRPSEPKPEQLIQPMPARFAPPMPVRARRPADEPAVLTPECDDAEPTDDGDAPVVVAPSDAPPLDLPPMIAMPADALAPVPDASEPAMKRIGPKLPDAEAPVAPTVSAPAPADAGPVPPSDGKVAGDRPARPGRATIDAPRTVNGNAADAPVADPVVTTPTAARPVPTMATRAGVEATTRQDSTPAVPTTPDMAGRRPVAPGPVGIGNIRRADPLATTPAISGPTPVSRFAPVGRGALPGTPAVDPVRSAWQVETPVAAAPMPPPAIAPTGSPAAIAPESVMVDPVATDILPHAFETVAGPTDPVMPATMQPLPPIAQPEGVRPAEVAPVVSQVIASFAPIAAPRRATPASTLRDAAATIPTTETTATSIAAQAVQPPVTDPIARAPVAEAVRAPIADAAARPVDPATVVIDQPAVPFTLPTERTGIAQPVAEPLTPNRQTIAGETSAPVVSVAAPTVQPVKAPPVTRVASAPAPEAVAGVVLADAPAPRTRRDDDALPLSTPLAPAIDAGTLRPVAAPVAAAQPHLDTRQPQWMEGMIDRIENLRDASPTQGETRIRLSPDALGDVEVAIRTSDDGRVHVHFSSDNADAGRLLADAQPRLVQLAEARGLKLGGMQVDVGTQQQPQSSQRQAQDQGSPQPRAPRSALADAQAPSTRTDNRIA